VLSYTVTQRRREFGVRVALGARPGDVLALVLRTGFSLTVAGLVLGTAGAMALARVLENLLFDVQTLDPAVFAGAATAMLLLGLLAGLLPAARATRLAPIEVLRDH
jgi:putative ABC transport system permease protein